MRHDYFSFVTVLLATDGESNLKFDVAFAGYSRMQGELTTSMIVNGVVGSSMRLSFE